MRIVTRRIVLHGIVPDTYATNMKNTASMRRIAKSQKYNSLAFHEYMFDYDNALHFQLTIVILF